MNFMNRKMFQAGGSVTYADGKTQTFDVNTFQQKINNLPDNDLFALKNSADAGQIVFSPELKSILDQATQRKAMPFTQNIGMKPASMSSTFQDYGRVAKGVLGPIASGLTRQIFSEEQLEKMPLAQSIAQYDSPFYGEGAAGFKLVADRAGRTTEELEGIIRKSGDIQDFTKDIEAIEQPVVEAVETKDVLDQPTVIEELPTLGPVTESETLGVMSPLESTQRRLAYEKAMIGKDEFGDPLPEGRLLQDPTIAKALEELTPIESLVDINKTEADSLLETQDKFDGKFDIPKIELDKVDTTVTEEEFNTAKAPVVPKETTGLFGSDRFLDFIRNVGGELTRTGQFGTGLSLGASKAAEERAARELMAEQEESEFQKALRLEKAKNELEGLSGPSDSMKKELRKVGQELNADYNDIVSATNTLEIVNRVKEIVTNEDTTSVKAFVGELLEKGEALFNVQGEPSRTGKSFADLEPRVRAKVLLNQIKQKNIRDILGESGKTISNLDRQIVEELVGSIALGKTPQETLEALRLTEQSIANNLNSAQNRLRTNFNFATQENGLYLVPSVATILSYIQTGKLPTTEYSGDYSSSSGVEKISLKE